ncbi:High affinity cationic amino acid transporter 1 [Cryptotermes secundus]|uniref:High affinity cationic amino acid transporter 1 n=1 Tax=Cryptotermes secundus TaxID=105785 RepID=A0A2J7R736_9NEOP|nr:High affinity cationic amino acid transporter 1 [Cryptotermes secundus]PNF36655.1 High affinity cationic amino acid transporter 1 [Cryptotermes secundus]
MVVSTGWSWWHALGRRKVLDSLALGSSELARVLSTFDLTALGVGSTLGVGVYVLAGNVSKNIAGPAVVVSFLIAAVASLFAGLCYAEFGARVPRAGSAYIYSYVCVGEFVAFIIGWNLILEYVIGSASVARGLSKYLDSLLNETMEQTFLETMPMATDSFALSPYFDIFAFGISFILAVALSLGVKESSLVNSLFTIVNIAVVLFVILAGSFKADSKNWAIKKEDIITDSPQGGGEGGFFPFGVSGAIKGAATCFYGFVGFDCVATTGEEVRNPQKAIPIAIILSLTIIFLSYFGVSTVLTLMWPYYLQDSDAPIPKVFLETGWPVAQWIVTIGGIFGLCASLFGAMFPLPRIIYAMAMDGLIFQFLGKVHHYFKTPFYGTLIAGLLTGLMAAIFDLDQLVNMMSIGTLLAYTIVAACVLLLRYTDLELCGGSDIVSSEYIESTNLVTLKEPVTFGTVSRQLFNPFRKKHPTFLSSSVVTVEVLVFGILSTLLGLCVVFWERDLADLNPWALSVTSVIGGILVLILLSVSLQPPSSKPLSFKVPFVPVVPAVSIVINIYLMLRLDGNTWIRFGVWMAIDLDFSCWCSEQA